MMVVRQWAWSGFRYLEIWSYYMDFCLQFGLIYDDGLMEPIHTHTHFENVSCTPGFAHPTSYIPST